MKNRTVNSKTGKTTEKYMSMYPNPQNARSGCKVGWLYYKSEKTAKSASSAAKVRAEQLAQFGYDFGYQSPGAVRKIDSGEFAGLFEVTIP